MNGCKSINMNGCKSVCVDVCKRENERGGVYKYEWMQKNKYEWMQKKYEWMQKDVNTNVTEFFRSA